MSDTPEPVSLTARELQEIIEGLIAAHTYPTGPSLEIARNLYPFLGRNVQLAPVREDV